METLVLQVQLLLENVLYRKIFLNEDPSPDFVIRLSRYYNRTQFRLMSYFNMDLGDMNENFSLMINQLYGESYTGLMGLEEEKDREVVVAHLRLTIGEYLYSRQNLYQESPEQQLSNLPEIQTPQLRSSRSRKKAKTNQ